ncbi:hypothetical protein NSS64_19490 [Paenibacillus sp. FSL H8-0122]|uniref:hypothetical protein n=1 Tax=Paenibacillus sp. FSL H8-0122 TaxID=2954510 RepID=UPI0030FABC44
MNNDRYNVLWTTYARVALARMGKFKVNSANVFKRSISVLNDEPKYKADGVSDFPGFEFNGYYWVLIGNVIIIYRIDEDLRKVYVDACYFANTGLSHYVFWGIDPDEE